MSTRERRIRITVNGQPREIEVETRKTLADALREDLGLTGTHLGCEHGVCGACTVLLDGRPARSCLLLAVQADGHEVQTVESLGTPEDLHPIQRAFTEHHALQCGFCMPGILMSTLWFLRETPRPSREEIREMLSGHLCRCTGYLQILDAIEAASRSLAESGT
jgi:carbon-monoxide dehydrogenase small subunit